MVTDIFFFTKRPSISVSKTSDSKNGILSHSDKSWSFIDPSFIENLSMCLIKAFLGLSEADNADHSF